ncbi:MAG: hypothetical protein ACRBN8_22490 [Nannocystales bacterium]
MAKYRVESVPRPRPWCVDESPTFKQGMLDQGWAKVGESLAGADGMVVDLGRRGGKTARLKAELG